MVTEKQSIRSAPLRNIGRMSNKFRMSLEY